MTCHDILRIFTTCHQLFQRGRLDVSSCDINFKLSRASDEFNCVFGFTRIFNIILCKGCTQNIIKDLNA